MFPPCGFALFSLLSLLSADVSHHSGAPHSDRADPQRVIVIHLTQAIYTRLWFMIPTAVLANIAEVLGWSARLWSSKNPPLLNPFLMQYVHSLVTCQTSLMALFPLRITTTIIAPTPLVAANFVILGQLIVRLGSRYSRLNGKWCTFPIRIHRRLY